MYILLLLSHIPIVLHIYINKEEQFKKRIHFFKCVYFINFISHFLHLWDKGIISITSILIYTTEI